MRDLDHVFSRLSRSPFRSRFRLGPKERGYVAERGLRTVGEHAHELIGKRLAPAEPLNDGRQTPMRGHPVFIAQHATGTCCRSCLHKWHDIPAGRQLSEAERDHVVAAIMRWIGQQTG
jgi:hypothetical protein